MIDAGEKDEEKRKELQTVKNDIGPEKILNVVGMTLPRNMYQLQIESLLL